MAEIGNSAVFSQTDASNNSGTVPTFAEGMAPSQVNDSARALQGAITRDWNWRGFTVTTTGSANAYVATYTVAPAAYYTGMEFGVITNFGVTGSATLNVNTLGAKTIQKDVAGTLTNLSSGDMASGQYVKLSYNGTVFVWTNWQGPTAAAFVGGTLTATTNMSGKAFNEAKGAAVASAGTTDIWTPADGNYIHITGTTTITSLGTAPQAGAERTVIFDGALTLTHNATSLILPGAANITTAAGDRAIVRADTTANMIVVAYTKASGTAVVAATSGPSSSLSNATTSGTTVDVTLSGTPTRIVVALNGVSGSGATSVISLLLGTGGGVVASGYVGTSSRVDKTAAVTSVAHPTSSFTVANPASANGTISGTLILQHIGGHTWSYSGVLTDSNGSSGPQTFQTAGVNALGAQITTIRLACTAAGTFDAGSYSVSWD